MILKDLFGNSSNATLEVTILDKKSKKLAIKDLDSKSNEYTSKKLPLYIDNEPLKGRLDITLDKNKKLDHYGIKAELLGIIEVVGDSTATSTFMSNGVDLEPSGCLHDDKSYDFDFKVFQKPYNSYYGQSIKLRYVVRCSILVTRTKVISRDIDVGVIADTEYDDEEVKPIKLEVGIEDLLNIIINIPTNSYYLKDVINGMILFENIKVLIKKMKLNIVRKEIIGTGEKARTTQSEINEFEIMDGCPIKEEKIPIRMFLAGVSDLTPTMIKINNKFSVRYFLHLAIWDDTNRKFFKQSEIFLYRNKEQKE